MDGPNQKSPLVKLPPPVDPMPHITEFPLVWPESEHTKSMQRQALRVRFMSSCGFGDGSTHELVFDGKGSMWISGQAYDHVAKVTYDGKATFYKLPNKGSAPHGLAYDHGTGQLWVALQGRGELLLVDVTISSKNWKGWKILDTVDINITFREGGKKQVMNTQPHGMVLSKDGSVWFTGKQTSSVGRVSKKADDSTKWQVSHFPLLTTNAVPIYIAAGPDGNMWCTELFGNAIARITPDGVVDEFPIPTVNSRPITIAASSDGESMWFSQEAGANVGRIDMDGNITEFRVPLAEREALLAAVTFDDFGNIWVQQYVSPPQSGNTGNDYIVQLESDLQTAKPNDLTNVGVTFYKAPSQRTVMHRIAQAPDADGTIWFTEMGLDKIGFIKPDRKIRFPFLKPNGSNVMPNQE